MKKAKDYLETIGKLRSEEEIDKLDNKIYHRRKLLDDYRYKRYSELRNLLWNARMNEIQRVKEKASEMEKNYDQ